MTDYNLWQHKGDAPGSTVSWSFILPQCDRCHYRCDQLYEGQFLVLCVLCLSFLRVIICPFLVCPVLSGVLRNRPLFGPVILEAASMLLSGDPFTFSLTPLCPCLWPPPTPPSIQRKSFKRNNPAQLQRPLICFPYTPCISEWPWNRKARAEFFHSSSPPTPLSPHKAGTAGQSGLEKV